MDDNSVNEIDSEADAELKLLFRSYCEDKNNNTLPFTDSQTQAISLAMLLVKQSASLESYNNIFEWHLGASGKKPSWQPLGESQHYLSRKKLIKFLHDRYAFNPRYSPGKEPMYYQIERTILPVSIAKVNVIYQNACDLVVSLLTDPSPIATTKGCWLR